MTKKQLKAKIAELEAEVTNLKRQVEIANQYAEIMRGYQPPYVVVPPAPQPFVAPGSPGYMPIGNPSFRWTKEGTTTA